MTLITVEAEALTAQPTLPDYTGNHQILGVWFADFIVRH